MEPIKIHRTRKLSEAAIASLAALEGQRMVRLAFDTVYANCTTEKQGIEMYGLGEFRIAAEKNPAFGVMNRTLLILVAFVLSTCTPWDKSDVKIERFEYLDSYYPTTAEGGDSLLTEAYLIHGYNSRYEDEIHGITDKYVCDSIIPNRTLYRTRFITFFKKTKNTNRENFQIRPKHKIIRAKSNDKLYDYALTVVKDSVIFSMRKQSYIPYEPNPPSQAFHCD